MAVFTYTPDYGAEKDIKPNVRQSKFGDGYQQRQANGINTMPGTWPLTFSLRTDTEADAVEAFLVARAGGEAFDWTPPSGAAGKYVCMAWRRRKDRYNLNTITCTFEQVYEP